MLLLFGVPFNIVCQTLLKILINQGYQNWDKCVMLNGCNHLIKLEKCCLHSLLKNVSVQVSAMAGQINTHHYIDYRHV